MPNEFTTCMMCFILQFQPKNGHPNSLKNIHMGIYQKVTQIAQMLKKGDTMTFHLSKGDTMPINIKKR